MSDPVATGELAATHRPMKNQGVAFTLTAASLV